MSTRIYTDSLLSDLKKKTAKMHEALESRVNILSPDLTQAQYRFLLERFYGFYSPVENRVTVLQGYQNLKLEPSLRWKTFRIVSDLEKLGLTRLQIKVLPVCPDIPVLDSLPQALGCMYVLEGATLGGQIIRRELRKRPEFFKIDCFDFYNSYGSEVGTRWKEFCTGLNQYALANPAVEIRQAIIDSAGRTFQKLGSWLAD